MNEKNLNQLIGLTNSDQLVFRHACTPNFVIQSRLALNRELYPQTCKIKCLNTTDLSQLIQVKSFFSVFLTNLVTF